MTGGVDSFLIIRKSSQEQESKESMIAFEHTAEQSLNHSHRQEQTY